MGYFRFRRSIRIIPHPVSRPAKAFPCGFRVAGKAFRERFQLLDL
jgi:hypothetical protein